MPAYISWTRDALLRLIRASGGELKAPQVVQLYKEDPSHREVIQAAGGLRRFCASHTQHFTWLPGPGYEAVREPVPASKFHKKASAAKTRTKRIARVAASFAGSLLDYFEAVVVSKDELWYAWSSFCEGAEESESGFGSALYYMVRWGVLARSGSDHFRVLAKTNPGFRKRRPGDSEGALEGVRPEFLATDFASPVPRYNLPGEFLKLMSQDVYTMQREVLKLLVERKKLEPKQITRSNYSEYLHAVLFTEELQMKYDISMYDLDVEEALPFDRHNGFYRIEVPGLSEKRPSVLRGDAITVTCKQGKFLGYVHSLSLEFVQASFHTSFQNKPPFRVHFDFTRTPLRVMHRAIDEQSFPLMDDDFMPRATPANHPTLNKEQRTFLSAALQHTPGKLGAMPVLLWGPPGTGKTTTLVNTIFAILGKQPSSKILVCAPSNPASDHICEQLAKLGVKTNEMFRLVAFMRDPRLIPGGIKQYTLQDAVTQGFQVPPLQELRAKRVIVSTCTSAAYIRSRLGQLSDAWFTHVFVDEAAQALEAEALVPLTLAHEAGRRFLAGDFQQLGPVVRSPVAIKMGLELSLMERIVQKIGVDHSRVFSLLDTYRAHPSILKLYNKTVYAGMLKCCSPTSSYDMDAWPECPRKDGTAHPLIFHHCEGEETRTKDSPSWQNVSEKDEVKKYLMKLLEFGVQPEDIGIISPYHKQCQVLNFMCKGEGVSVEVGTTELFQGREKRVIIISTVRSRKQDEIGADFRFSLGFLGNYKRTNVALSRAKSMLIVVGNMTLLSHDATWHNVIKIASDMGCMRGGRFEFKKATYGESSEWGQAQGLTQGGVGDGVVDRPWRDAL